MTHKQQVIKAIKALDFRKLDQLLDDDLTLMRVPKELF